MRNFNLGLLLLVLGTLYLLGSLGIIDIPKPDLASLWPLIPLVGGLNAVVDAINRLFKYRTIGWYTLSNGLFWTGFGLAFLARNFGLLGFDMTLKQVFWPLLLVWLGIQFISKATDNSAHCWHTHDDSEHNSIDTKHHYTNIGEMKLTNAWTLTRNSYSIWVGEVYIDVTKAFIPNADSHLELRALAGDVTVVIPRELGLEAHIEILAGDIKVLEQHESGAFKHSHYRSPNWETAEKRLTLSIKMKAGDISVRAV